MEIKVKPPLLLTLHQSHSITYRIAEGSQKGKKVFTLQTLPPIVEETERAILVAKVAGFSLHAGVSVLGQVSVIS